MLTMSYHFKATYRRYLKAREAVNEIASLRRLEYEVEKLKVNMADLNKEFYKTYEREIK